MIKIAITILLFLVYQPTHSQTTSTQELTATYFESGVNSPWMAGLDYDFGFGKLFSFNIQFTGGISSQVNRASTFGDVFLGELQIGGRMYMNKIDTWEGLFLSVVARVGIYSVPIRTRENPFEASSKLIIDRSNMFQYGMGIYLGYKWKKNLMNDMTDMPFTLVLEPYLGWNLDFFTPIDAPSGFNQRGNNINRFSIGLNFKIGFYTYKKSKATLALEAEQKAIALTNTNSTTTNTQE